MLMTAILVLQQQQHQHVDIQHTSANNAYRLRILFTIGSILVFGAYSGSRPNVCAPENATAPPAAATHITDATATVGHTHLSNRIGAMSIAKYIICIVLNWGVIVCRVRVPVHHCPFQQPHHRHHHACRHTHAHSSRSQQQTHRHRRHTAANKSYMHAQPDTNIF